MKIFSVLLLLLCPVNLWAACVTGKDFGPNDGIQLVRKSPQFNSLLTHSTNDSILEHRTQKMGDGRTQKVVSSYQSGVWATLRKGPLGTLELRYGAKLKSFNLSEVGKRIEVPVTLVSDGKVTKRGTLQAEVKKKVRLKIGRCKYQVIIIRSTILFDGELPLNRESFYQPDLGFSIAGVTMNEDWTPRTGVFFDQIKKVKLK